MSTQAPDRVTRPILKYLGGKWRIAPWIISHFPPHVVYVEPFGGGGNILLRKPRSPVEVFNDLDEEIVNIFRVARDDARAERLQELLNLTPWAAAEVAECFDPTDDLVESARRVICRSFFLLAPDSALHPDRTMRRDPKRNMALSWQRYMDAFEQIRDRLKGVVVECLPATKVMNYYDTEDTLHYLDPPYVKSTRGQGSYRHEMSDQEHADLARVARSMKGFVLVSGYDSPLYDELYRGWAKLEHGNHNTFHAKRKEVLWLSPGA